MAGLFQTWCERHGGLEEALSWLNAKLRTGYSRKIAQNWLDGSKLPCNEVLIAIFCDTAARVIEGIEQLDAAEKSALISQLSIKANLPHV